MPTDTELRASLLANPDDATRFQVYADFLSEKGDPLGELISVQMKLEQATDPALAERSLKLIADHGKEWLGELAGIDAADLALTWRRGFLDSARVGPPVDDYGTSELDFPATIKQLLALPSAALLRELVIGAFEYDDYPTSWQDCIDAIAESDVPRTLQVLEFNRGGYWDISSTELGDLSAAYPKLQNLRELKIEMGSIDLGDLALPKLRKLEIVTGGLQAGNITQIVDSPRPELEHLSLYIGETGNDYGCDVELDDLQPIFDAQNLPRVRHLGLANSSLADDIAKRLVGSKILPQLESLDLSHGTFGAQGARVLLENAAKFAHLKQIDLTRSYVHPELAAQLSKLGPSVVLDDQEGGELDGSDERRYCSVSE